MSGRVVYFVEGAGLIKIGCSSSALDRFFNMLTGSPVPLSLLASMPGGPEVENELHRRFAEQRSHGEWFHSSDELRALIAAAPVQFGEKYRNILVSLYHKAIPPQETPEAMAGNAEWNRLLADLAQ